MSAQETSAAKAREALREQLWPDSGDKVWKSVKEKGYFPSPRNLPLLLHLLREKSVCGALNPALVYVELLHRDMGQGIVEILDEDEHAYCAGDIGSRAVRSWRERVLALQKAGFINVFPKANRAIGYVVIMHPRIAVTKLRSEGKVPDQWWQLFQDRQRRISAPTDQDPQAPKQSKVISIRGAGARQKSIQRTGASTRG